MIRFFKMIPSKKWMSILVIGCLLVLLVGGMYYLWNGKTMEGLGPNEVLSPGPAPYPVPDPGPPPVPVPEPEDPEKPVRDPGPDTEPVVGAAPLPGIEPPEIKPPTEPKRINKPNDLTEVICPTPPTFADYYTKPTEVTDPGDAPENPGNAPYVSDPGNAPPYQSNPGAAPNNPGYPSEPSCVYPSEPSYSDYVEPEEEYTWNDWGS